MHKLRLCKSIPFHRNLKLRLIRLRHLKINQLITALRLVPLRLFSWLILGGQFRWFFGCDAQGWSAQALVQNARRLLDKSRCLTPLQELLLHFVRGLDHLTFAWLECLLSHQWLFGSFGFELWAVLPIKLFDFLSDSGLFALLHNFFVLFFQHHFGLFLLHLSQQHSAVVLCLVDSCALGLVPAGYVKTFKLRLVFSFINLSFQPPFLELFLLF